MKEYLKKLPAETQELISLAADIAAAGDMRAYLVGGFVRDLILGIKNLDLDIVVEGNGIKFAEEFASRLKAKLISHRRFATATVTLRQGLKVDIATAREEYYPHPASLPVVKSGTIKDDLKRRDFSINAMAISINQAGSGCLIDFFAGEKDLAEKKIRILHDLSFIDDPTRILRAIRFEKRYGFRIEPGTLKLLKEAVRAKMLLKVEPQRLRDELILILKERRPLKQISRIKELAGLSFIHRRLKLSRKIYALLRSLEGQIKWFKRNYPQRRGLDNWLIYLFGLLEAIDIPAVRLFCKRYAFRRGEIKRMLGFKKIGPQFVRELTRRQIKPAKIFGLLEPLSYEVILAARAKYKDRRIRQRIADFFEIYNGMRISTGGDDLHRLGLEPGPAYKKIFTEVLTAKINGEVKTKEEEIALINKLFRKE